MGKLLEVADELGAKATAAPCFGNINIGDFGAGGVAVELGCPDNGSLGRLGEEVTAEVGRLPPQRTLKLLLKNAPRLLGVTALVQTVGIGRGGQRNCEW